MNLTWRFMVPGVSVLLGLCTSAVAHHSHGNYAIGEEIQIEGVVTELLLRNPHVWVFLKVNNDSGTAAVWGLESGGIVGFRKSGWAGISIGDNLSVKCAPARDGAHGCFINDIVVKSSLAKPPASVEWIHYADKKQHFMVNFPKQPTVRQAQFLGEYGATYPSTVYESRTADSLYSLTVVDYSNAKALYEKLADKVNVAGVENFPLYDQLGSVAYAARKFRLRGGEVTYDAWHHVDFIEGHQIFVTNRDKSRTYAGIYRHASRLFILEATVPASAPPQGIFQQSLTVLDDQGKRIRYDLKPDHTRVRVAAD